MMGKNIIDNPELYYNILSGIHDVCAILISSYCCVVWTRPFLDHRKKAWLAGAVYAVIMLFLNFMPWYITPMLVHLISALAVLLMMCLIDRKYIAQKLFLAITFFCLRWQAMRLVAYIQNEIYGIFTRPLILTPRSELFWFIQTVFQDLRYIIFIFLFQYGAVRCILWSYRRRREHMNMKEFLLLSVPSMSGVMSYGVIRYYNYIYERDTGKSVYDFYASHDYMMAVFTLFSFAMILVTTYVFCQWKTEQEENRQREIFSAQMADLQSHISEVERLYRDLRGLRHDMGNHLMTLKQLYDNGEYEAAEQYAGTLRKEIQNVSGDIASGNPVTDVILSGRKKEMEEKGIVFFCDFHYPMTDSVNSFDVSIILNNALSNAIEAVEREQSGSDQTAHISLSSHRRKNMYIIEVSNSYTGNLDPDPSTGLPCSSKTEKGHGFGLISIRHVARKYLGDIEIGKEICEGEERCVLRVMLQITEESLTTDKRPPTTSPL